MVKKKKPKICKLNAKQDRVWVKAFEFHMNDGKSSAKADKLAFKDLVKEFPSLKKCDKIK